MQSGRIHRNVATLVDPPTQRPSDAATALDLDEARAVLATSTGLRNSARWTVALALGLRQSEALALQWRDIDLLNNTLSVRRTLHRVKGGGLVSSNPRPSGANARSVWRCHSSPRCTRIRPRSWASGCWPGLSGRTTTTSSLLRPTVGRSTRSPTTTTGVRCCSAPGSGTSGCTTAGNCRASSTSSDRTNR